MHLIIFDIDGTLILPPKFEADLFELTLKKVTGISKINKDLHQYQHITDMGIARECIFNHFQRTASANELIDLENQYTLLFEERLSQHEIQLIPGVHTLFEKLMKHIDVRLAIATGNWLRTAKLKLHHAKLPLLDLPIASSNDSFNRIHIMQAAFNKIRTIYPNEHYTSVTYVGDGPWDVQAAKTLEWNFIAIASHYSQEQFYSWGAKNVINDYLCENQLFDFIFL